MQNHAVKTTGLMRKQDRSTPLKTSLVTQNERQEPNKNSSMVLHVLNG